MTNIGQAIILLRGSAQSLGFNLFLILCMKLKWSLYKALKKAQIYYFVLPVI